MKNILVVDDTKNIRILIGTCLELEGYKVFSANTASSALEIIRSESLDLAFIDIKLPNMSGTELLRVIRKEGFDFPVVIMTAFATIKNAVETTKLGAKCYLQKPFTADKIKTTVNGVFNEQITNSNHSDFTDSIKLLIENKDFINSYEKVKTALSFNPKNPLYYDLLGEIFLEQGNDLLGGKFKDFSKSLKEVPTE